MTIPFDDDMMERFVAYGQQCYGQEEKFDLETKKRLRSCLSSFEQANLIIYWTRPAVALKFKKHDRNKDFFYNAYPCPCNICYRIHMLVSILVGIEMAEFVDTVLAERPVETWEGFAEKGMAVLLEDPEVVEYYERVVRHGRQVMQAIVDQDIEEFVACLLLVIFSVRNLDQDFEFLEFFAGRANLTYAMRQSQRKSARFDILHNSRFHKGGKLRSTILMYLVTVVGGVWLVEQPGGSSLEYYPCFRDLLRAHWDVSGPCSVFRVSWWVAHYGSQTPKRHYAWCNSEYVKGLCRGRLQLKQWFARHLVKLASSLTLTGKGCPPLPKDIPEASAQQMQVEEEALMRHIEEGDAMPDDCEIISSLQKMIPPRNLAAKAEPAQECSQAAQTSAPPTARTIATPVRNLAVKTEQPSEESEVGQAKASAEVPPEAAPTTTHNPQKRPLDKAAESVAKRMVAPHKTRTDLQVPEYLKKYWEAGTREKDELAELLKKCNFDRDSFICTVERVVTKKEKLTLKLDQGWYSEGELRDELHWAASRIEGVKRHCMANKDTHVLHDLKCACGNLYTHFCFHLSANVYDGELEFWVTVRERGERKETVTREERQSQKEQGGPVEISGKSFAGLESMEKRFDKDESFASSQRESGQYMQEQETLKKFCDSLNNKSCKLRGLIKDLETNYAASPQAKTALDELNKAVQSLDHAFEDCNVAQVHAEVHGLSAEFKKLADGKIKKGYQPGKALRGFAADIGAGDSYGPHASKTAVEVEDYMLPQKERASCGLAEVYARCRAFDQICFQLPTGSHLAGNVLLHASTTIERLFNDHTPMIFKIGWTHDPAFRWANSLFGYYHDPYVRWDAMVVLYVAMNPHGPAMLEVPAKAVVRTARNIVADLGTEAASSSRGLKRVADCSLSNAERDTNRVLTKKFKLALPIPLRNLDESDTKLRFPVLRLRDWAQYLLDHNLWHTLCGLRSPDIRRERAILSGFWAEYRRLHPNHTIFQLGLSLEDTVPMVYHGDEGRGRRRQGWLVTNYHSILGRGIQAALDKDARDKRPGKYLKLRCNYVGHSLTNRRLERKMGRKGYMVVLNVVGDWGWLHKAGGLCRTYNNMVKAGAKAKAKAASSKKPKDPVGICHLCRAGQNGVPFEEIHSRRPAWLATMWLTPPSFARLDHSVGEAADIFAFDIFHAFHLGVGKVHVSSCIAVLSDVTAGSNIDSRFELLNREWKAFKAGVYQPKLTQDFIGWNTRSDFPTGSWHRGQLTTDLMLFLEKKFQNMDVSSDELLLKAAEATSTMNECLRLLYQNDSVFLPPDIAHPIAELGIRFLRRYSALAKLAYDRTLLGALQDYRAA
ncbi:unnamed protein product [Symbiodinium necroappetens]|uniref:Uncharacterized protein n=1 Tax=Symbiodinium necroappetens TaxID=1628268 RepID=A0A812J8B6_9DINO|nr:unnamed protein product [Symbiodinium necroappetens]